MDAQIRRRRTHDAIKRILLRESLNKPLMVIFEDLHWIDAETEAALGAVTDAIANAPILLLLNYRPEYSHRWGNRSYYTQLRLVPLRAENADELVSALVGDRAELTALKGMIIEKTEGNPFFIEEMVQALFEQGVLVRNGTINLAQPFSQLRLPTTVQGVLSSRIDRLPSKEKEILQTLAVIGREFPLSLARRLANCSDDQLDGGLTVLQDGEFINELPGSLDIQYAFKHGLTQEARVASRENAIKKGRGYSSAAHFFLPDFIGSPDRVAAAPSEALADQPHDAAESHPGQRHKDQLRSDRRPRTSLDVASGN
jgi:predicted ATPase